MSNPTQLVDRYVAIWSEPDSSRRRQAVAELWTEDALHLVQPPEQVYESAAELNVTPTFQSRGHHELEGRVSRAYEQFVLDGGFAFRSRADAARLGDLVKFSWEMVASNGETAGVGLEFVLLAPDGRIQRDYQFIIR